MIFGIYKPIMELAVESLCNFKTHVPKLIPVFIGVSSASWECKPAVLLSGEVSGSLRLPVYRPDCRYAALSVQGSRRTGTKHRILDLSAGMYVCHFLILFGLKLTSVEVTPNFFWYLFCGFCLALSVIAPGMSFSTLLMPLGLYTPFVDGIGHFDLSVLIPAESARW